MKKNAGHVLKISLVACVCERNDSTWTYEMKSSFFTISLWSLYSSAVARLMIDLK